MLRPANLALPAAALAALAILFASATASATLLVSDPRRTLQVNAYTWDAHACIVKPDSADKSACLPADRAGFAAILAQTRPAEVFHASVVHFDGYDVRVVGTRVDPTTTAFEDMDPSDVTTEAREALEASLPPGAKLVADGIDERTKVEYTNGVGYVRLTPTIDSPSASKTSTLAFVVPLPAGTFEIAFSSDAAHAADLAKFGDNAIASLIADPFVRGSKPARPSVGIFTKLGRALGTWTGRAVVLLILAGVFALFRERKRHAAEP
jgi:hypothetical protein